MENKKTKKYKILFFIFLGIFLVGLIGLAIPFDYEKYSYSVNSVSKNSNVSENSHTVTFTINLLNSGSLDDALLQVDFSYKLNGKSISKTVHTEQVKLKKGLNSFKIEFSGYDWGNIIFNGVDGVKIHFSNNSSIKLYTNPLFSNQNLAFFSCIIVGLITGAITLILWKTSNKVFLNTDVESTSYTIENSIGRSIKTFEEKIKEAFTPVVDETKSKQKEKLMCNYCKCIFDYEKHDKCPHCGAPPERKD